MAAIKIAVAKVLWFLS